MKCSGDSVCMCMRAHYDTERERERDRELEIELNVKEIILLTYKDKLQGVGLSTN